MAAFLHFRPAMSRPLRVAVLAYHSQDLQGNDYHDNDHVALAEDLRNIAGLGLPLVPAVAVAEALRGRGVLPPRCVCLTCDDGALPDFADVVDPRHGAQKSFFRLLGEAAGAAGPAVMTSFVIADPEARATLERTCLDGRPWMGEAWWPQAVASGRWHLGCHSWDHQHPSLPAYAGLPAERTEFRGVDGEAEAEAQVGRAAVYLRRRAANPGDRLFAYPYGHWTDYLVRDYLPTRMARHGLIAAFTTRPEILHEASDPWRLPRFVCRADWKTPEDLLTILRQL
jgi:peptidoglycan/xylan/chitin deacetylase (PgdA/CDA1 family)